MDPDPDNKRWSPMRRKVAPMSGVSGVASFVAFQASELRCLFDCICWVPNHGRNPRPLVFLTSLIGVMQVLPFASLPMHMCVGAALGLGLPATRWCCGGSCSRYRKHGSFLPAKVGIDVLQRLRPALGEDALTVIRGHLHVVRPDCEGFCDVTTQFQDAIAREKTQLWRVQVYRQTSPAQVSR